MQNRVKLRGVTVDLWEIGEREKMQQTRAAREDGG
jgi:hypothetical protein